MAKNPKEPKNGSMTQNTQFGHKYPWTPEFHPWPLETTRGHKLSSRKIVPSSQGKAFPSLMEPLLQEPGMGIYGIIYNYAPFFLSNPMVKISSLLFSFSSLVNIISIHFKGKTHLTQVGNAWWNPEGHLRTPTP
ncbi:hypothetical protein O181_048616 [Austropuccinia psidii MF-1]|uniref:Uncharacterized protein n=1 Tax=Austropuccinia psidii MF-1 TaxID=1389203 RepID=A0A9Q3HKK4_9BASI|nr:hypothetical protein [Austropuccinia psidii MF-1]